ncbi:NACHT domain-containing NTPase [Mycobacterium sp. DBP42]|uniref:NACHT domain-containing protein n=1 Tax=Mycobacterium sp. DBP42 TaxID=2545267 RepID=UPI00110C91B7|nr:hypothetical protein [Mycobacterium sp. DBP42]TMS50907.1 hypothetical protein E0T84_22065 [Mycobacterium sp. DBP42]
MENDFAYEQLSPRAFEQLGVAITEKVIGVGLEVFGPGRDGGREATWNGPIRWAVTGVDDSSTWRGYTVIQVKHCQNPTDDPAKDLAWLVTHIKKEFDAWMAPASKRTQFPDYLLIITNVRLTPADPGGTMAKLNSWLDEQLGHNYGAPTRPRSLRSQGLREVKIWHRNKLNTLLTNNADARQRFTPLITVGDILARINQLPGTIPSDLLPGVFIDHACSSLGTSRWIRFDDAGDGQAKHAVDKVVVNLPVETESGRSTALGECLRRGDAVLRRSLWRAEEAGGPPPPRHLVITGAPGNGKSTLTRYLTHAYRAAFVRHEGAGRPDGIEELVDSAYASLDRLHLEPPKAPRWAVRVELAAMAHAMGPDDGGPSLYKYLSEQVSLRSHVHIEPHSLISWLKVWPGALFFDGLDEVAHPAARDRVINEITRLVGDADDADADLFIVITTRPTGYTERQRLLPEHFDQIDLAEFTRAEAAVYGEFVTAQRLSSDEPEYRNTILAKLAAAIEKPNVYRLLKTPLQVLILTIIVANAGVLPTNRYRLFWTYFDTVFKREANKDTSLQSFFNTYRTEIEDLHLRIGLILHERCETTPEGRSRLPLDELRDIAFQRLREDEHSIPRANELAERLVNVATQRLVLLAADEDHTVSFDVRSLQELMAGRALINGAEADIRHNLTTAARSPHWRNAWLFAAGEMFTGSNHERSVVLDIVETCDEDAAWPGWLYPTGPQLAADILDDGLAANKPIFVRRLVQVSLRSLNGPMPTEPKGLAHGLTVAAADPEFRALIRGELKQAISGQPVQQGVAASLLHYGDFGAPIPGMPNGAARYLELWTRRSFGGGPTTTVGILLWKALLGRTGSDVGISSRLRDAVGECDKLGLVVADDGILRPLIGSKKGFDADAVLSALKESEDAALFRGALDSLDPDAWPAKSYLARSTWAALSRVPIANELHTFQTGRASTASRAR